MKISNKEYFAEVNAIAKSIIQDAMEQADNNREDAEELISDSLLHEAIDGHQWIIYYGYNLEVYEHSDNSDYYIENFGDDCLAHSLKEGGLNGLHQALAFWGLYADVNDKIQEYLDEYENNLQEILDLSYEELLTMCEEKELIGIMACIATDEHNLLNTENLSEEDYDEYKLQMRMQIVNA